MKPTYRTIFKTSQRGSRRNLRNFPKTDYHFQTGADLAGTGATTTVRAIPSAASSNFRKWSTAEVARVNSSDSRIEAVMFGVVIVISVAGPLALLWITLANYWL